MTLYERLEEKAKEMGFSSMTKFFDTAEVNTNARQALKKTGRLSDTYKMRIARVLKMLRWRHQPHDERSAG